MSTRSLLAEAIGTFALVFIGAGVVALGYGGLIGAALAHGLIIFAFVSAYGHISGGHFNPAVSFAFWLRKKISSVEFLYYSLAQIVGAVLAAFILAQILGKFAGNLGAAQVSEMIAPWKGFFVEAILTFFLVSVILHCASSRSPSFAPLVIGLTLTCCILMGGPLTIAALNPARALGPAFITQNLSHIWVYLFGPMLGAFAATHAHDYLNEKD